MAVHQRNTASSQAQEPPLTIARVALYARVSTLNGQDPEMQLSELREYASRRGWTISSEYVVRNDVAAVGKFIVANGAFPCLLDDLSIQQLPHLGW